MAKNKTVAAQPSADLAASISAAIERANTVPPEIPPPAAPPEAPPPMIEENDPEGRQAGDPNDTITLPPELLAEHRPSFKILTTESELTEEEVAKLTAPTIERRPDVALDNLPQPAVLSQKTLDEMGAGKTSLAAFAELNPHKLLEKPPTPREPFVERPPQGPAPAQAPVITSATRLEMEAGRAMVEKREAEYARNRAITAADAARRAADGAPADSGDLDYTAKS